MSFELLIVGVGCLWLALVFIMILVGLLMEEERLMMGAITVFLGGVILAFVFGAAVCINRFAKSAPATSAVELK